MADAYWRYGDSRQQAAALQMPAAKRPRSDYDVPSDLDLSNYYAHEDERVAHRVIRDTDPIGASYDRYLRNSMSSYAGGESTRSMSSGIGGHPMDDPHIVGMGGSDAVISSKSRSMGVRGGRSEVPLPPDASSTLFVEGLPANCTRREVAHIFRPFVGYKEVRLVTKESRHPGGDPLVLCFVDFVSPAHAATAMDALQVPNFKDLFPTRDSAATMNATRVALKLQSHLKADAAQLLQLMPPSSLASVSSFRWGSALAQGAREEMEDDLLVVDSSEDFGGFSCAAVFDGHAGFSSVKFLRNELYKECVAALQGGLLLKGKGLYTIKKALEEAFTSVDVKLLNWFRRYLIL